MQPSQRSLLLFAVIFIEGYAVLASELVAIRLLIPFVGSGVEMVAIVVSAVLLPLAAGYHFGGRRYQQEVKKARAAGKPVAVSVRKVLIGNLTKALAFLTFGLSYIFLLFLFEGFAKLKIDHNLIQAAIYSAVFLVYPVFLLAQTVPLVANYFSHAILSQLTGRMLFFSTLGSFMGSVISTLILMNLVGVSMTALVIISMLFLALLLLHKRLFQLPMLVASLCLILMVILNVPQQLRPLGIVNQNAYSTVAIRELHEGEAIQIDINHSPSSVYSENDELRWGYVKFIEQTILQPAPRPLSVLILGAGGFTIGFDESRHHYTYVDIDPDLKEISEEHVLPHPLAENQVFVPKSARAFLIGSDEQYDVIIADAYTNSLSIPMEMTTIEFWHEIDQHLKPGGVIAAHMLVSANYSDQYAIRTTNTFNAVFPHHTRQTFLPYSIWEKTHNNILYIHQKNGYSDDHTVYTDDLNPYSMDHFR